MRKTVKCPTCGDELEVWSGTTEARRLATHGIIVHGRVISRRDINKLIKSIAE